MGIRVNVIHPGIILTEMTEGIRHNPALKEQWEKTSALGILGEMDDIGCCALYLASDASRFVTGMAFVVDGGASCRRTPLEARPIRFVRMGLARLSGSVWGSYRRRTTTDLHK